MKIRLAENGMWGNVIPDVVRNNRISLKFGDNLRIDLSGKEFDSLKSLLNEETQNWFRICQKIVKGSDNRDKTMRKYYDQLMEALNNKKTNFELVSILMDFYNDYWNADLGEVTEILPIDKTLTL